MTAYVLMLAIPMAIYGVSKLVSPDGRNSLLTTGFFCALFILLAFRDLSVGVDLDNYQTMFQWFKPGASITEIDMDPGYALLNKVVYRVGDFRLLVVVIAAICVVCPLILYRENKDHQLIQILLFINMASFVMMFSGLRQSLAFSIGVFAYKEVRSKRIIPFLMWVLLAYSFHSSAFILLLLYPVYHCRIRNNHLLLVLPVMMCVFLFNRQIFTVLLKFIPEKYLEKYSVMVETGAYTMIVLFSLFAAFAFIVTDNSDENHELNGLKNVLLLVVVLQCFAPVHNIAMRFNYYFIIFVPFTISKVMAYANKRYKQVAILAEVIMCLFFVFYFFYNGKYGADIMRVFPYLSMWEGQV